MAAHQEDVNDPNTTTIQTEKLEDEFLMEKDMLREAAQRTEVEHNMSIVAAVKLYPWAVFWSLWLSTALIMEGFDHAFTGGFYAFPAFQKRYGELTSDGTFQIPAKWQSAIGNCVNAGEILGLLINGIVCDIVGYRWMMIGSLICMIGFIFIQFFATSIEMYLAAELLLGFPWGVFQTLTTTYAAEICPVVLRPYLTMAVCLCWSVGYFIGSATLRGFLHLTSEWAYRIPFALQWVWPIPLMIGIYLAPESPWWLVRKGRIDEAEKVIEKLISKEDNREDVRATIAMMLHTDKVEREMNSKSTYINCFQGIDLRRTEVTVTVYIIQYLCSPLMAYITYFLEQAGLSTSYAFDLTIAQYCIAIVGVILSWATVKYLRRRTMYLGGVGFVALTLLLIGFLGIPNPNTHPNIAWGIGSVLLVQNLVFYYSVGAMGYTIVSEMPSNHLRTKSLVLARGLYNAIGLAYGQLIPRMVQKASWNWGAKSGFFFGGILAIFFVWAFFRLPETKGRTFAEVDILFKNRVAARKFADMVVDLENESVHRKDDGQYQSHDQV
ncbi:general substrate transporter [Dipodascopsis uninucleata]